MDPREIVCSTSDAAFAVDDAGTVVAWNRAAGAMLGVRSSAAIGRRCWEVVEGTDLFGNTYCYPGCPLLAMARHHKEVGHSELLFLAGDGSRLRIGVNTVVVPGAQPSEMILIHLLRRLDAPAEAGQLRGPHDCVATLQKRLTDRETEILALLADGLGTREIARRLLISDSTARNHIQHILQKLKAHSRLEAVSVGRRLGLLSDNVDH